MGTKQSSAPTLVDVIKRLFEEHGIGLAASMAPDLAPDAAGPAVAEHCDWCDDRGVGHDDPCEACGSQPTASQLIEQADSADVRVPLNPVALAAGEAAYADEYHRLFPAGGDYADHDEAHQSALICAIGVYKHVEGGGAQ